METPSDSSTGCVTPCPVVKCEGEEGGKRPTPNTTGRSGTRSTTPVSRTGHPCRSQTDFVTTLGLETPPNTPDETRGLGEKSRFDDPDDNGVTQYGVRSLSDTGHGLGTHRRLRAEEELILWDPLAVEVPRSIPGVNVGVPPSQRKTGQSERGRKVHLEGSCTGFFVCTSGLRQRSLRPTL